MKILIISQYFWPENFRINDLALGLKEKGHDITVLTGIPNYPKGKFFNGYGLFKRKNDNYNGIRIFRVLLVSRGNGKGFRLILNYLSFAIFSCLTVLLKIKENYDIIFVYEPSPITVCIPAILLKKIKKIPICLWVLDLWPESVFAASNLKSRIIDRILKILVKFIYKHCNKILVQSRAFIPSIIDKSVDFDKIEYFPNWAEDLFHQNKNNSKIPYFLPDGFIIIFAGNIGEAQDFPSILNAAEIIRKYDDIHWVILGDGRKKSWIEDEIKNRKLNKNFHLLGNFQVESMPLFFSKADVLLVTLKKDPIFSLTIPGKVQSYMSSAKPILAMIDGEGARIINEGKSGLTCSSGDTVGLAKNVIVLYKMKKIDRKKMGENGRKYYEKYFNRKKLISKVEKLMSSLIK